MLWIIFALLFTVLIIYVGLTRDAFALAFLIFLLLILMPIATGIFTYPDLCSKKEKVLSLQSEIETVRGSHYSQVGNGSLVGGSLDNLKQSTELSEYIKNYATEKASYNESLKSAQIRKQMPLMWWVGDTLFMDDKVLELKRID